MNVTILHGYSASNSGDGLLVDLAIALVLRNFGADTSISVVASDPNPSIICRTSAMTRR